MWFWFPYLPSSYNPTLNINLRLVKYLKIGTFSDLDAIFFCKMFEQNKIISLPTLICFGMK